MKIETDTLICTVPQRIADHETFAIRSKYAADARAAGIAEAIELIATRRPAAALRRVARIVEEELAIEGLAGIRINTAPGMAAIGRDKHAAREGAL